MERRGSCRRVYTTAKPRRPVNASIPGGRNNGRDCSRRGPAPTSREDAAAEPSNLGPRHNGHANRKSHRSTHSLVPVRNRLRPQPAVAEVLQHSSRREPRNRREKVSRRQVLTVPVSYAPFLDIETRDGRKQLLLSSSVNDCGWKRTRVEAEGVGNKQAPTCSSNTHQCLQYSCAPHRPQPDPN
jgi:hypothetical protein